MICLAADTLTDTVIRGYREAGLLTSEDGGFALAEAGVALVLERLSKAQARGARIYGEVLGYGIANDAKGVGQLDPRGRGLERAMRDALEHAEVAAGDVTAIWGTAPGHRPADVAEEAAIRRVFDKLPPVITPKRLFGEPMGAGGSLNVALALKSWQHANADQSPPGLALINSSSLGGTHFSIILSPYFE
jgi:3-oxoacyl-[acyl-carrier-protein] synthase II